MSNLFKRKKMIKIALLGSTGSIGRQVVNTVLRHSDKFKIVSLAANSNYKLFSEQVNLLKPRIACLTNPEAAAKLTGIPDGTTLYTGEHALSHAITEDCDVVFSAVSGFAGLEPCLEAIEMGKDLALANKETLVAGGELVMKAVKQKGVRLIPVDSEHSAIFQCLNFDLNAKFKKLILTASGGAFRNFTKEQIAGLKASEALKHPNWLMGKKITVDCATLLNKGLEVIEACHLYSASLDRVEAIVHPESIIHSMVEFDDGAIMAQLGYPSMEIPIQLALTYPERLKTDVPVMDLVGKSLNFSAIDNDKYPCFSLALKAFEMGDNFACAMNAANEAAVELYLEDRIGFYDVSSLIEYALSKTERIKVSKESLLYTDGVARRLVYEKIGVKN